jgi:small GTP-binding protein
MSWRGDQTTITTWKKSVKSDAEGRFELERVPRRGALLGCPASGVQGSNLELDSLQDPTVVTLEVDLQVRVLVDASGIPGADRLVLLDGGGRRLNVTEQLPDFSSGADCVSRGADGFPPFEVSDTADTLVVMQGDGRAAARSDRAALRRGQLDRTVAPVARARVGLRRGPSIVSAEPAGDITMPPRTGKQRVEIQPIVIGTAGHIDHGKSSLVRALTGVDPDRLKEEKERGLTIDLGYAPLVLPDGRTVGIIDVPGHERFVRNMVAGATGIDLVVLVVAADDGVMPQTREHLHIMELLGVKRGFIALNKVDMVDADQVELALLDVRETMHGTFLADAPIVPVSAVEGTGLDELKRVLFALAAATAAAAGRRRVPHAGAARLLRARLRHRGHRRADARLDRGRRDARGAAGGAARQGARPAGLRPIGRDRPRRTSHRDQPRRRRPRARRARRGRRRAGLLQAARDGRGAPVGARRSRARGAQPHERCACTRAPPIRPARWSCSTRRRSRPARAGSFSCGSTSRSCARRAIRSSCGWRRLPSRSAAA